MPALKYTKDQHKIFRSMVKGESSIIKALAGTGKSSTMIEGINRMMKRPENDNIKGLFVAFNKKIQLEIEAKLRHQPNWEVRTLNSLGFGTLMANSAIWNNGNLTIDEFKSHRLVSMAMDTSVGKSWKYSLPKDKQSQAEDTLLDAFTQARIYGIRPEQVTKTTVTKSLEHLNETSDFNKEISAGNSSILATIVSSLLNADVNMARHEGIIDFDDQIYLAVRFCPHIGRRWDKIIFDEAQDGSEMNIQQVVRACRNQLISVGDKNQTLYQFRGAVENSFELLAEEWKKKTGIEVNTDMKLALTFRCPKSVVKRQHSIIDDDSYKAHKSNGTGRVVYPYISTPDFVWTFKDVVKQPNSALLAPFNYVHWGAVSMAWKELGIKSVDEIRDRFDFMCEAPKASKLNYIRSFSSKEIDEIVKSNPMEAAILSLIKATDLDNDQIISIFAPPVHFDNRKPLFTTVHRAKGAEWNNVFLLDVNSFDSTGNIRYVAETRTKKTLNVLDWMFYDHPSNNSTNFDKRKTRAITQFVRSTKAFTGLGTNHVKDDTQPLFNQFIQDQSRLQRKFNPVATILRYKKELNNA